MKQLIPSAKSLRELTALAVFSALMIALQVGLSFLPNIELVSFLIIVFTKKFGNKMLFVIPAYVILEILVFGFDLMWALASCYIWLILYVLTIVFGKTESSVSLAVLSGLYGLVFGFL